MPPRKRLTLSDGELYLSLLHACQDAAYIAAPDGEILDANESGARRFGLTVEEIRGRNAVELSSGETRDQRTTVLDKALSTGQTITFTDQRAGRYLRNTIHPVVDKGTGEVQCVVVMSADVTELVQQGERFHGTLADLNSLQQIVARSPAVVIQIANRPGWPVLFVTPNVRHFGYAPEDVLDNRVRWSEVVHPDDLPVMNTELERHIQRRDGEFTIRVRVKSDEGCWKWIEAHCVPVQDELGNVVFVEAILLEVTDRVQHEQLLQDMALTDEQTGLYNRRAFTSLANQVLRGAERSESGLCLLFCDMDGLKTINDAHGHAEGDRAIREIVGVLKACTRKCDIVARMGGDEFAIIGVEKTFDGGGSLCRRIRAALDDLNSRLGLAYTLGLSVGRSLSGPNSRKSLEQLLEEADLDMYQVKKQRRAGCSRG